jgi:arginase family enzyme
MLFDEHFDLNNDLRCGFSYIRARELDKLGVDKVVEKIKKTVGDEFVYLSVDIDVLDPGTSGSTATYIRTDMSFQPSLRLLGLLNLADGLHASYSKS